MTIDATTDAVLVENPVIGTRFDLSIDADGDILTNDFFDTALIVSLFSDRRASSSEVLLPENRRGWIGNEFTPDFEIGSRLWLFEQARLSTNTINEMVSIVQESLQWLIDDNLALSTAAEVVLQNGTVFLNVTITRVNSKVEKRLFDLWENSGVTTQA